MAKTQTTPSNTPSVTGVQAQVRLAGSLTPAFFTADSDNADTAGLAIFNPVVGNVDTTSTHSGDLGGTAS